MTRGALQVPVPELRGDAIIARGLVVSIERAPWNEHGPLALSNLVGSSAGNFVKLGHHCFDCGRVAK